MLFNPPAKPKPKAKETQKVSTAVSVKPVLTVSSMKKRYVKAKLAMHGENIECPYCGKVFVKKGNKTFCSNGRTVKGKSSCKDKFHNSI
ncbi:hypothetical protein POP12_035 [Pectobacterium phage POP12]|nr:hypothetical protein POP12_035 [Pectobacterium phage POP12]